MSNSKRAGLIYKHKIVWQADIWDDTKPLKFNVYNDTKGTQVSSHATLNMTWKYHSDRL